MTMTLTDCKCPVCGGDVMGVVSREQRHFRIEMGPVTWVAWRDHQDMEDGIRARADETIEDYWLECRSCQCKVEHSAVFEFTLEKDMEESQIEAVRVSSSVDFRYIKGLVGDRDISRGEIQTVIDGLIDQLTNLDSTSSTSTSSKLDGFESESEPTAGSTSDEV